MCHTRWQDPYCFSISSNFRSLFCRIFDISAILPAIGIYSVGLEFQFDEY